MDSNSQSQEFVNRLDKHAINIIKTVKKISISPINKRLIDQLVGSAGSIGANYCEAIESESKKDFVHKICISKKETKETIHWLRLLAVANPEIKDELEKHYFETKEILLIFSKIISTSKNTLKND